MLLVSNIPSPVIGAYRRQEDWNQQLIKSQEADRLTKIQTDLGTAAKHAEDGRHVAAYHGYLAVAEDHHDREACYQVGFMLKEGRGVSRDEKQAFFWLSKAAEQGDPRAHLEVGKLYAHGTGVPTSYVRAIEHLKLAADLDEPEAWCELGKLHSLGYGQEQDYQEKTNYQIAVDYFNEAEQRGSKTAQAEKAKLVERELVGTESKIPLNRLENDYGADYSQELAACRKGIQADDPHAFYTMGMLYLEGHGIEKSLPRALEYLEQAAQRHDRDAKSQLTRLFNHQTDIKLAELVACYEAAVNNNEPWALVGLGKMYALGLGVQKSFTGAICLFKIAAELKNPYALYELGKLYALGYGQKKENYEAARDCFKQAMADGVPEAQGELGKMDYWRCGNKDDFFFYSKDIKAAAEQGLPEALFYFGMDQWGNGLSSYQFCEPAVEMYKKAAALGSVMAMCRLGYMYKNLVMDYASALKYYRDAAVLGHRGAIHDLGTMYVNGEGVTTNHAEAIKLFRQSAALGNPASLYSLGLMYRDGQGVPHDVDAAIDCLRRAAELGVKDAWVALEEMEKDQQGDVRDCRAARAYYEQAYKEGLPRANEGYHNDYGDDASMILRFYQKRAAEQNDPRALYNLGMLHLEGRGVEKNLARALEYLERAALLHDREAKHQLTRLLTNKSDTKSSEVVACYKAEADNNAPWALVGLGKMYALGLGVKKNITEAIRLFKCAVELKNPYALCELGKLYALGYGQEEKYDEAAIKCFKQAMENGVPEAQCELGSMYYQGRGVDKDDDLAFKHIQTAAEQRVPDALFCLGWMYEQGHGVQKNSATAVEKHKEAAALGSASAMKKLGYMYQHAKVLAQNYTSALKYYRAGAALGYDGAINNLGFMYDQGKGVTTNYAEASKLYRQSAGLGNTTALCNLGLMYCNGQGVPQDSDTAINCYRRAAELGEKEAWVALEKMEKNQQGDVRDYRAARAYYEQAHEEGLPRANEGYRNDYGNDASTILRFYQKRAEQNDPRALYNLGMLHLEGRGVEKNLDIAMHYLNQAAELGDAEAKNRISKMPELTYGVMSSEDLAVYTEAAKQYKTWGLLALGKLYADGVLVERDRLKAWGYLDELVSLEEKKKDLTYADQLRMAEAKELLGKLKFRKVNPGVEESTKFSIDLDLGNPSYLNKSALNEIL